MQRKTAVEGGAVALTGGQPRAVKLKDSVYALAACEPAVDLYFSIKGAKPALKPLATATLAPATRYCRGELVATAIEKLAGQACELVRVDG